MKQTTLNNILSVLFVIFVVSLCVLFYMIIIFVQMNMGICEKEGGFKYEVYEYYSIKFQSDPIILDISESCIGNDGVSCVFEKINEPYDYDRANSLSSIFRTPSQYFELGGVCRDISNLRHSALDNLGVDCSFNFTTPDHVFLNCEYEGDSYELNNGRLYINGRKY